MSGFISVENRTGAPGFIHHMLTTRHSHGISILMASLSLVLWAVSIAQAKGEVIGDYGLFSVLPATYYLGVFLLLFSMFYAAFSSKYNPNRSYLKLFLFQSFILMAFMLFTPTLIEGTARSPHSWLKYGYADYIVRNGHISQAVTYYHNWPAPFIYTAELVLTSSLGPEWFPAVFPLVLDTMIFVIVAAFCLRFFKTVASQYLGIMLFLLVTWENQFHYVPQLFAFLLLLLIIYLGIFYLKKDNLWMLAIIGLLFVALLLTHLLTVFVAGLFLCIIVLFQLLPKSKAAESGRRRSMFARIFRRKFWHITFRHAVRRFLAHKRIVAVIAVIAVCGIVAWYVFARDWIAFVNWRLEPSIWPIMIRGYINKLYSGSDAHGNLVLIRMAFTVLIAALALVGGKLARDRSNVRAMYAVVIAGIAPVFLFYYEAEILQRSLLFCGLALAALMTLGVNRKKFLAVIMVFCFAAVPLHTLAMYGNEKIDYTPPSQIPGAEFVFENIPGGYLISGNQVEGSQYIERYSRPSIYRINDYHDSDSGVYLVYTSTEEYFALWYLGDEQYISLYNNIINQPSTIKIFNSPDCQIYIWY